MKDNLGDRMKMYENLFIKDFAVPYNPIIARLDGKSFHTFCKGLNKPFDENFCKLMIETTKFLIEKSSAKIGYTQSDEITLIWDNQNYPSKIIFDGKFHKLTSILASMCTAFFNKNIEKFIPSKKNNFAFFDCRVFQVPTLIEALNILIWRELDATRNSISAAAQANFSHKQLQGKNSKEMQEMLFTERGINWNDYPTFFKRGTYLQKQIFNKILTIDEIKNLPEKHQNKNGERILFTRSKIDVILLPVLAKIENKKEIIKEIFK